MKLLKNISSAKFFKVKDFVPLAEIVVVTCAFCHLNWLWFTAIGYCTVLYCTVLYCILLWPLSRVCMFCHCNPNAPVAKPVLLRIFQRLGNSQMEKAAIWGFLFSVYELWSWNFATSDSVETEKEAMQPFCLPLACDDCRPLCVSQSFVRQSVLCASVRYFSSLAF